MTALTEFLFPAPAPRSLRGIVGWWERRRLAYNLCVGAAGVLSLGVVNVILALPPGPHRTGGPPWVAVVAFGVMANLCYLLGPSVEYLLARAFGRRMLPTGPTLYRMGLTFSVGLALLPTLFACLDLGLRILRSVL